MLHATFNMMRVLSKGADSLYCDTWDEMLSMFVTSAKMHKYYVQNKTSRHCTCFIFRVESNWETRLKAIECKSKSVVVFHVIWFCGFYIFVHSGARIGASYPTFMSYI